MKIVVIIFLMLSMSFGAGNAAGGKAVSPEKAIIVLANEMNKMMPMMLNKYLRADSVLPGPGKKITFFVTVLVDDAANIVDDDLMRRIRTYNINSQCTSKGGRKMLMDNVIVSMELSDKRGVFISKFSITEDDCRQRSP